jgi:predicted enzyme related to lactoylglutathione lyase
MSVTVSRPTMVPGAPIWADLGTPDRASSIAFYAEVFGWTTTEPSPEFGGYSTFLRDGLQVGGVMAGQDGDQPSGWTVYLMSEDVDATAAAVLEHGGTVTGGPHPVGDLGVMLFGTDPAGTRFAVWQSGQHRGYEVVMAPGAPGYHELHTPQYAQVLPFYTDVFGIGHHVVGDSDEFRYSQLVGPAGEGVAGVMDASAFLAAGDAGAWELYLGSDDVDRDLAKVVAAGGTVRERAMDTPYGRLARFTDPNGASVRLVDGSKAVQG